MQNLQSDSEEYRLMTTGHEKNLSFEVNAQKHEANACSYYMQFTFNQQKCGICVPSYYLIAII